MPEAGHGNGIAAGYPMTAQTRAVMVATRTVFRKPWIIGIAQEFAPVGQRQDGLLDASGHESIEGEHHHDGDRHHQEQDQERQDRRQQQPGLAVRLGSHGDRLAGPLTKRLPRS